MLDAMVGPEAGLVGLRRVGRVGDRGEVGKGLLVGVVGGKRDMVGWMPVLGGYFELEGKREEFIDGRDDVAAVWDC